MGGDEGAPATEAGLASTEEDYVKPGHGPGLTSSLLMGESFSAKSSSAIVAVPPGRMSSWRARNISKRASRLPMFGFFEGMVVVCI